MDPDSDLIVLEPKYCELCGGLWLRPAGSSGDCCPDCHALESELALVRRARGGESLTHPEREEARPA